MSNNDSFTHGYVLRHPQTNAVLEFALTQKRVTKLLNEYWDRFAFHATVEEV